LLVAAALLAVLTIGIRDRAGSPPHGDASARSSARPTGSGPDLTNTVFVYESFAVQEPGCGAISAFDVRTGAPIYVGPSWSGHGNLAASPDLSTVLATWKSGGGNTVYRVNASAPVTDDWHADRLREGDYQYDIGAGGGIALLADGDRMLVGMGGPPPASRTGVGLYRLSEAVPGNTGNPGVLGARYGYYGTWSEAPRVILPDPTDPDMFYVLTHESRLPATVTDTVKSQAAHLHTIGARSMTAPVASISLPDLVVDDPPGGGLRETGIHATIQHGDIGYATMLAGGDPNQWPTGQYVAVSRWAVPELAIADVQTGQVRISRLADDLPLVSGIAANHGPENPGLVAVHAGDRIAVYEVDPLSPVAVELSRVPIAPVLSGIEGERRMMGGPIAWSADGTRIIAAANEGLAEFVVLAVFDCGRSLRVDYYFTACAAEDYNGGRAILTANGPGQPRPMTAPECPTPYWWPGPLPTVSALLPFLANGHSGP
jgi:hypothetical protein